jgi:hypothetical protein
MYILVRQTHFSGCMHASKATIQLSTKHYKWCGWDTWATTSLQHNIHLVLLSWLQYVYIYISVEYYIIYAAAYKTFLDSLCCTVITWTGRWRGGPSCGLQKEARNPNLEFRVGWPLKIIFRIFQSDLVLSEFPVVLNSLKSEIFQFWVSCCFESGRSHARLIAWPMYSNITPFFVISN